MNPRGWIYTPIHFRNVQHRKRYFYLRSGIFIQLWTTTRLRTIVLPFYFSQICMQRHDCSDVMTFYALFKTVCNTGGKFEEFWTQEKILFISVVGSSSNYGLQLGYVPLFCLFTFRKYVCRGMIAAMSWLFMPCSKLFAIQAVNSKKKKKRMIKVLHLNNSLAKVEDQKLAFPLYWSVTS